MGRQHSVYLEKCLGLTSAPGEKVEPPEGRGSHQVPARKAPRPPGPWLPCREARSTARGGKRKAPSRAAPGDRSGDAGPRYRRVIVCSVSEALVLTLEVIDWNTFLLKKTHNK